MSPTDSGRESEISPMPPRGYCQNGQKPLRQFWQFGSWGTWAEIFPAQCLALASGSAFIPTVRGEPPPTSARTPRAGRRTGCPCVADRRDRPAPAWRCSRSRLPCGGPCRAWPWLRLPARHAGLPCEHVRRPLPRVSGCGQCRPASFPNLSHPGNSGNHRPARHRGAADKRRPSCLWHRPAVGRGGRAELREGGGGVNHSINPSNTSGVTGSP